MKAMSQASVSRADQGEFRRADPDLAPPRRRKPGRFRRIGAIGFEAARLAPVGIGGVGAQFDEIEHVDRRSLGRFLKRPKLSFVGSTSRPFSVLRPRASL